MATNPIKEALQRVEDETQGQEQVEELALDSIHFQKFTPELTAAIEKFPDLLFLSLNDCLLTTLTGFPKLPKLIRLELTDNKVSAAQLANVGHLTELQSLSLGGNPISNFDELNGLTKLNKLIQMDLFGCPVSEDAKYREKIFSMFPSLQILDNKDKEGVEVDYDEEEDDAEDYEGDGDGDDGDDDEAEAFGESDDDDDENANDDESDDDDDEIERKATQNKKLKK
jgi:hypothetical protein